MCPFLPLAKFWGTLLKVGGQNILWIQKGGQIFFCGPRRGDNFVLHLYEFFVKGGDLTLYGGQHGKGGAKIFYSAEIFSGVERGPEKNDDRPSQN